MRSPASASVNVVEAEDAPRMYEEARVLVKSWSEVHHDLRDVRWTRPNTKQSKESHVSGFTNPCVNALRPGQSSLLEHVLEDKYVLQVSYIASWAHPLFQVSNAFQKFSIITYHGLTRGAKIPSCCTLSLILVIIVAFGCPYIALVLRRSSCLDE